MLWQAFGVVTFHAFCHFAVPGNDQLGGYWPQLLWGLAFMLAFVWAEHLLVGTAAGLLYRRPRALTRSLARRGAVVAAAKATGRPWRRWSGVAWLLIDYPFESPVTVVWAAPSVSGGGRRGAGSRAAGPAWVSAGKAEPQTWRHGLGPRWASASG